MTEPIRKINLDPTQASLAVDCDEMVIVVPLKYQVPSWLTLKCPLPYGNKWWIFATKHITSSPEYEEVKVPIQHPIDSTVFGREAWMMETEQGIPTGGYIYRATNRPEPDNGVISGWYSSQCMPTRAIRHQFVVTANRVEERDGSYVEVVTMRKVERE